MTGKGGGAAVTGSHDRLSNSNSISFNSDILITRVISLITDNRLHDLSFHFWGEFQEYLELTPH